MGIELVIFDCDGVLVDSERLQNAVLAEVLGRRGVHMTEADVVREFIGLTIPANFAGTLGYAATPATADAAFVLAYIRAGTPTTIGTITMASGSSAATLSTQAAVDLLVGDILRLTAPSPQDATLANASITLLALRT